MIVRVARPLFVACIVCMLTLIASAQSAKTPQDQVSDATTKWLKAVSTGDRAALNAIMDARFVATTPAGDVISKNRLVPDDPSRPVQQLPPLQLDSPLVRVYADTAVLMGRLKSSDNSGQLLNSTFVYTKQNGAWKLIALQLSPQK